MEGRRGEEHGRVGAEQPLRARPPLCACAAAEFGAVHAADWRTICAVTTTARATTAAPVRLTLTPKALNSKH